MYFKRSKRGIRIFDSCSNEPIHNGFLKGEKQVKRILIKMKLEQFFKDVVEIEAAYLDGYTVNGSVLRLENSGYGMEEVVEHMKNGTVKKEAKKIMKKLRVQV